MACDREMAAWEFILSLRPAIPFSAEREKCSPPSNGEVKRWLQNGAVHINGKRIGPQDTVTREHVRSLVFFPASSRRTTVI